MSYNPNGAANNSWGGDLDQPETAPGGLNSKLLQAQPDMSRLR